MNNIIFNAMFVIVPIFIFGTFIFMIAIMFSPKLRGKVMTKQIKATKYMLKETQDDFTEMGTLAGNISAKARKQILDENEEVLKDIELRSANIEKESIKVKMGAIKDGFSTNTMYCKHCGTLIDEDSRFCKSCGKEQ